MKYTKDSFIEKAKEVHGVGYNYTLVDYINNKIKVRIICPFHGGFEQTPNNHLRGQKCPKCSHINRISLKTKTTENFIEKSKLIHNNAYDYSKVNYINNSTKVKIICRKHGEFDQLPKEHLRQHGCPKCKNYVSKPEIEVQDFVKSLGFKIKTNDRKIINPYELDIYIPELNKAIEFNGTYYHYSKKYFIPGKHSTKSKLCKSKNINLLHLREDLWNHNKEKMKKVIHKFLDFKN